jgi:hypothetical protein
MPTFWQALLLKISNVNEQSKPDEHLSCQQSIHLFIHKIPKLYFYQVSVFDSTSKNHEYKLIAHEGLWVERPKYSCP